MLRGREKSSVRGISNAAWTERRFVRKSAIVRGWEKELGLKLAENVSEEKGGPE